MSASGPEKNGKVPEVDGIGSETRSHLPVDVSYGPAPGEPPFTRGIHPTMYRSRLWTMRQYAGFGTAAETNRRFRYLLDKGQTGLSVAFDLPTQMGYDSSDGMAAGEVGRVGVAIDTVDDMQALLDGIPLGQVSTSMTINATAPILLALYCLVAERQGVDWKELRGTVQNDVLKEYVARGTYIYPAGPSMRLTVDLFDFTLHSVPQWNPISVSGYHISEAGANAVQEVAFTLSNGIAYLQAAKDAGLPVADVAKRMSFFFAVNSDLFEEVAKFRAARRIWSNLLGERFGIDDPGPRRLRFHAQTAGSTLTAQSPLLNVPRVTLQALAAVLGGAQSLHTNSYDEALSLPSREAAQIALRTQQIVAYETGVTRTVDPLGGSDYVESLTDRLEEMALQLIGRVDDLGGALAAIETGFFESEITESAREVQRALEEESSIVVGVNRFRDESDEEEARPEFELDPESERAQVHKLDEYKKRRDSAAADRRLVELRKRAEEGGNLIPGILDALRAEATLGEISHALEAVFGRYEPGFTQV